MTIKEIEKKLKRVKKGNTLIQRLQLKYQSLESGLLSGTTQFQTRVTTSKTNTAEKKLLDTLELRDEIADQIQAIISERIEVMEMLNQLEEIEEWLVLTMLYVNNLHLAQICREMKISKVNVYRIRNQALENLVKVKNTV